MFAFVKIQQFLIPVANLMVADLVSLIQMPSERLANATPPLNGSNFQNYWIPPFSQILESILEYLNISTVEPLDENSWKYQLVPIQMFSFWIDSMLSRLMNSILSSFNKKWKTKSSSIVTRNSSSTMGACSGPIYGLGPIKCTFSCQHQHININPF